MHCGTVLKSSRQPLTGADAMELLDDDDEFDDDEFDDDETDF